MHTTGIYIVIKHYNNLNQLFTLTLYGLVIVYCYMYIFRTKIRTKSIKLLLISYIILHVSFYF